MEIDGFHVRITREAHEKMKAYIALCPMEVSGFGKTVIQPDGILIEEVFLIKQEVTGATTEMDPQAVYQAVMDAAMEGEDTSTWGLWWHSHVNFAAFFSGQDMATIEALKADTPLVSIVSNKKGEYFVQVDMYKPFRLSLSEVPLEVVYPPSEEIRLAAQIELNQKVRMVKPPVVLQGLKAASVIRLPRSLEEIDPDLPRIFKRR